MSVEPAAFILGALLLLVLPLPWVGAALMAAAFHELCHIALLYLTGGHLLRLKIGAHGAALDVSLPNTVSELLCAAAGPLGSLFLASLYPYFPRTALCALAQGLFNLLPIYPLDGGRILRAFLQLLIPKYGQKFCDLWDSVLLLLLFLLLIVLSIQLRDGFLLPLIPLHLHLTGKRPCKLHKIRVQ